MSYLTDPNELNPATVQWFRDNVLFGFMKDRERWRTNGFTLEVGDNVVPWFGADTATTVGGQQYRPGTTGEAWNNGFDGPVPIEAVHERLFNTEAMEAPVFMHIPCDGIENADTIDDQGRPFKYVKIDGKKAVYDSGSEVCFQVHGSNYQPHQFREWLLTNVGNLIDDELGIESAAKLKQGAVAFVSVSLPDTVQGDAKFPLLVKLVAFTSLDGSLATTYQRSAESPVCSNSFDIVRAAAREHGKVTRVKHTRNSGLRVETARQALSLVYQHTEETIAFFDTLAKWEFEQGKGQARKMIETLEPIPEPKVESGKVVNQSAITRAEGRQDTLADLYANDARVKPWRGTALGMFQAANTYDQQVRGVRGVRAERQMLSELNGDVADFDSIVLNSLSDVTGWGIVQDRSDAGVLLPSFDLVRVEAKVAS